MNILISCIGKRGYLADFFRPHIGPEGRVIGTSNTRWTPGFDACDEAFVLPDIETEAYVPALLSICQECHIDGILPQIDPDVMVLSQHLDELRDAGVAPVVCSPGVSGICSDKYRAYLFLKEHRFATPHTYSALEETVRALEAGTVGFPLFVKPRCGFGSKDVFYARDMRELEAFFSYKPDMIVQEEAPGQEHHLDVCTDFQGTVLSVVPKRKIKMHAGETDQAETIHQAELMEAGIRLGQILGGLGHVGPLDVDVFLDGSRPVILDMNPRFGGAYPASHLAGADFAEWVVKMIRGESIEPRIGKFQTGVRMMKSFQIVGGRTQLPGCHISDGAAKTGQEQGRKSRAADAM